MKYLHVLYLLLFVFIQSVTAQVVPPINSFNTEDYKAENQNWSISQDENKLIYIANNKGLLEYNGESWELYKTPNETIMRSVFCFKNLIYTGFFRDFGYWKRDAFGELQYTSLTKELKIEMLGDEQIWEIYQLDGWLIFKSLKRIYLYNPVSKEVQIINAKNTFTKLSIVDNTVYYQDFKAGIFKLENGTPILLSTDYQIINNKVVGIFQKQKNLFFVTQYNGIFQLQNNEVNPWLAELNSHLENYSIYSFIKLSNNDLILGTISNGVVYIKNSGEIKYQINQQKGLNNNTVLNLFEDANSNIWLALDNGISTINLNSPFQFFYDSTGVFGTVYAAIIYQNDLYVGTNQGLFIKKEGESNFKLVKNTQGQVWYLTVFDDTLFCGHDTGTLLINNNEGKLISNILLGTWMLKPINESTILQGNYDGFHVLKKDNKQWIYSHKIKNYSLSSKHFVFLNDTTVLVNHEYKGVLKVVFSSDYQKVIKSEYIKSVDKSLHSSIVAYQNDILYSSKNGVYSYNNKANEFKKDTTYSKLLPLHNFESAKLVNDSQNKRLWSFTKDGLRYISPGNINKYQLQLIPIQENLIKSASGYETIINLYENTYLIGTTHGYVTLNLDKLKNPTDFTINLHKIKSNKIDEPTTKIGLNSSPTLSNKENNIEFFVSATNYDKTAVVKYIYKLEGYNEKWSEASNINTIQYENLKSGTYTFMAYAIINGKKSTNQASFTFTIDKPWYASNTFVFIYFLLGFLIVYSAHFITRKYYQKQRAKILEKSQRELELKELENSKQLIKLNNERLKNEVESKNRELATSTMSIIKKNEFLNQIKAELATGETKNVNKVIKIIDKDLNNSDDWEMFQQAFNNADKKFLRKIKTKHPDLTPNDLRLCAYLRLNLSSKEIAPLLNISPRSVEVKRYRLRKKLNIDHDINLTNYIIEL